MSTNTLTSLAILKVNIDQGKDYLSYLEPFILQVLVDHCPDPVTDKVVSRHIREQFGLEIPERTVQLVLKRMSRNRLLTKTYDVFRISNDLPDPQITVKQSEAEHRIRTLSHGLCQFSQDTSRSMSNPEDAVTAMCAFLAEFDIACLRYYLKGTAIPPLNGHHDSDIVLVSEYIQHVEQAEPERFENFLILLQGHMLANALMCPDLENVSSNYRSVVFYLDTPLLVQRLGLEGEVKQTAVYELISLLNRLKGKIATFSHSREELQRVLHGTASHLESSDARGLIVMEARKNGTTKSDLLLLAESIEDKLGEVDIEVVRTPPYIKNFQIDETVFENVLSDEVSYMNPRAKEYDINSVRSIYAIRGDRSALSLEKSRAVLVTSNTKFAKAAWHYGQQFEASRDVSSVISDFSLANAAWLKAPLGACDLPKTRLLAFSYAALQPSYKLLNSFMTEIDRLQNQGKITARDHQLLRSSPVVKKELIHLTQGNDASLTAETIAQTLERVVNKIKKEDSDKLTGEQEAHQETQKALKSQQALNKKIIDKLYWRCDRNAKIIAWMSSGSVAIFLILGFLFGLGLRSTFPIVSWSLIIGSSVFAMLTMGNLLFGSTVKDLHTCVYKKCMTWLLKREAKTTGVDFSDPSIN
ncbi:MAG: hypothetical protein OXF97_10505 [Nitrospira sp.]|nr:hypothetical protein [Nitrospira sp.]